MVASFVSRANSGYTNRSDDRKSMASLASMMSGRVRLQRSAVDWAAREHPLWPAKEWVQGATKVEQEPHVWTSGGMLLCTAVHSPAASTHALWAHEDRRVGGFTAFVMQEQGLPGQDALGPGGGRHVAFRLMLGCLWRASGIGASCAPRVPCRHADTRRQANKVSAGEAPWGLGAAWATDSVEPSHP